MYEKLQILLDKIGDYPKKPHKPILLTDASPDDIRKYADDFEKFLVDYKEFEKNVKQFYENKKQVEAEIKALICSEAGMHNVPEQYREKVWRRAFEDGHGNGWHEVYHCLCSLVEIFE